MKNNNIDNILASLAKSYQQKYGVAVFSIKTKKIGNGFQLNGAVLTENQKDELLHLADHDGIKISGEKIIVLSDEKKRNEIGWGVVKTKIADVKSRFVSNSIINEKIMRRIRCSQAFKNEVLRILLKKEDQLLVQQGDLTLGWVDRKHVAVKKENLFVKWGRGVFAPENSAVKIKMPKKNITKEAEKFIGTKYVLGGKSENGIDCSGFVQAAYKNAANIILPKHSWDQKKVGKKIELKDAESGDLIFLVKKRNSHKHVGIVAREKGKIFLIHASLDQKEVIAQDFEEVLKNYDFVEARRIVK